MAEIKKKTLKPRLQCPACKATSGIARNGLRNGKQRYKCQDKECGKTFYERGLVLSRTMMAREVIILTLLGYTKQSIAELLEIGEKTVARHLSKYTKMAEFEKIIPVMYERIDEKHITKEIPVPIYHSWVDVPDKARPFNMFARNDLRKKTVTVSRIKAYREREKLLTCY